MAILVGISFFLPEDEQEKNARNYLDRNCFGCLLNAIAYIGGLLPVIYNFITMSIHEHWWIFLLFFPCYFLSGFIKTIICFIIPFDKLEGNWQYDAGTTRLGVKRQFGTLIVIATYIVYFIQN